MVTVLKCGLPHPISNPKERKKPVIDFSTFRIHFINTTTDPEPPGFRYSLPMFHGHVRDFVPPFPVHLVREPRVVRIELRAERKNVVRKRIEVLFLAREPRDVIYTHPLSDHCPHPSTLSATHPHTYISKHDLTKTSH